MALRCESRAGVFRSCGETAVGVCHYCNRPFCARHGAPALEGEWACFRSRCQMKATVIGVALASRRRAQLRNAEGLCGASPCGGRAPQTCCSLCGGAFCVAHLNAGTFRVLISRPDEPPRYRRERHYLCDECAEVIARYRLITLPPIPTEAASPRVVEPTEYERVSSP
ncbi:MAG: hypothetical protein KatS3mg061_3130 [Dehalococcoidia bacterium]|nr:MAG: hypothetical protein KatS3mg061_3130 [Dehalococcoidia bacterium]